MAKSPSKAGNKGRKPQGHNTQSKGLLKDILSWRPSYQAVCMVNITYDDSPLVAWWYVLVTCFLGYFVVAELVFQKGYQYNEAVTGLITPHVYGVAYGTSSKGKVLHDARDLVYPPKEVGALFITTMYEKVLQKRGLCLGTATCNSCPAGQRNCPACRSAKTTYGPTTGLCLRAGANTKRCELEAWCPTFGYAAIAGQADQVFLPTVPTFNITLNIFTKFARYNISNEFSRWVTLAQVLRKAGVSPVQFVNASQTGLVVQITVMFDCDLDIVPDYADPAGFQRKCAPELSYLILSDMDEDTGLPSQAYRFQHAEYLWKGGVRMRENMRSTGVRVLLRVAGRGRKFEWNVLLLKLGSGMGLLGAAAMFTNSILSMILFKSSSFANDKQSRNMNYLRLHGLHHEEARARWEEKHLGIEPQTGYGPVSIRAPTPPPPGSSNDGSSSSESGSSASTSEYVSSVYNSSDLLTSEDDEPRGFARA